MGTPAPSTPPSASPAGTDLRARILAEGTRLFADRGYSGTSIREVVEAAGCTKPALYYHFTSKEGLFLACIRSQTDLFTAMIEESVQGPGTPRARITAGLRVFFEYVRVHPTGIRLIWRAEMQPETGQPEFDFDSLRTRHTALVKDRLAEARLAREIREDVDLDDATHALVGMIDQRLDLWARGGDLPEDLPERLLSLFFDGVAP
jgi:TetR/AcrR family transcriptional regulator